MIPLKLQIKNFVSYGAATQTIDFAPYQLICLSGKNGHGKSALLDALTWVLWGQARKLASTGKADEGLLRLGQTNMLVNLDFICNNQQYRVRREYTHSSKAYTQLDFGIIDQETQVYRALTDKTIKATQEKIETTLGLDFDAFSNSAFLRQGHSNEFSRKTPKERKEVLATILGINHFEKLRKRAAEYAKEAQNKKEYILQVCDTLSLEVQQKSVLETKISTLTQELSILAEQEHTFKQALQQTKQQYTQLAADKTKRDSLAFQHDHITTILSHERSTVIQEITGLRQLFRQQRALRQYAHLEHERQELLVQLQHLQKLNQERLQLKEEHLALKEQQRVYIQQITEYYTQKTEAVKQDIRELTLRIEHEQQKYQELNKQKTKTEQELQKARVQYTRLEQQLSSYTVPSADYIQAREKQFEKRKAYSQAAAAKIQWITQELTTLDNKKQLFEQQDNPSCPLCQQDIHPTYRQKVTQEFTQAQQRAQRQLKRLTVLVDTLSKIVTQDSQEIARAHHQAQAYTLCSLQAQELAKTIDNYSIVSTEQSTQLNSIQHSLAQYQQQQALLENQQKSIHVQQNTALIHDTTYQELIRQVSQKEERLAVCTYSTQQEQTIIARLEYITQAQCTYTDVTQALALKEQKKQYIRQKITVCKQLIAQARRIEQELAEYTLLESQEILYKQKEAEIETVLAKIHRQKESLLQQLGALEQQQLALEQREQEHKAHKATIQALDQATYEYQAIAHALSKDGIQALLIEDALPEIEQEANNLLSRLTDNQAHLSLESLRDLRSGGTKETLDIKISDSVGTRAYELFSGGEAFRIDFALRIAISKLLARRAGTALQTLIIDEGFGSQDEEGLGHIMESLYKIQDEFAKVIVVSHLSALKEQFPVHFLIYKGPEGSTVKVLEQG